ncbi:MAG TPA: glycosyltransferase [Sphingomicrobium sp.]|nr:glycosyltransferase [Sphingomicrobium sp.]
MARVAFLLPDFCVGGAERVALTLIEAFVKRGIEVDLVLLRKQGELLKLLPSSVKVFSLNARRIRQAIRPLAAYLRERRPDALQASMWPVTLVAIAARWIAGCKCRLVISDHAILSRQYAGLGGLHDMFLRGSIAALYPRADARVAVSEGAARDLSSLGCLDRESIDVIHNPVSLGTRLGAEPDWGGEGVRVLAVGSLKPVKNYPLLLEAFAQFAATRPARLLILGEGELRLELEQLATTLGIADRVMMPGEIGDPSPYYASAQLLVLSSDHEGYGNVLVEALHHGLTMVSTDCPSGPSEILDGGRFGYLVPCGDARALAEAIAMAADAPMPPQQLIGRARSLSGPDIIDRYLHLLLPGMAS